MGLYIYTQNLTELALFALAGLLLWFGLCLLLREKRFFRPACSVLALASLYIILRFSVIGRATGGPRHFVFAVTETNEFVRELFMNVLLYLPFGMAFSVLAGGWAVPTGFLISFVIEAWQYLAGAGTAQGTDVICNTLGSVIGALPWIMTLYITRRHDPSWINRNSSPSS